jgi:hypothetical protein
MKLQGIGISQALVYFVASMLVKLVFFSYVAVHPLPGKDTAADIGTTSFNINSSRHTIGIEL